MTRTGSEALETTGTGQPDADTQNTQTPAAVRVATPARGMPVLIPGSRNHGDLPHGCRCGKRWGGNRTCHCGSCHLSFSGSTAFDLHRKGGTCNNPASLGLAVVTGRAYECWGNPGEEQP